ncbi:chaplin [Streptomyces sp. NPDC017979]|uniref:chaplin n=1 Tax=unclassified Streptomyces TaxID=2593676 RepID=UPI0037A267E0
MRQVTRKGLITMAAAGGALALGGSYAQADSGAFGAATNSPGVASGNNVQVPVNVPVNACGNSVDVVGLLNPAFGNECANTSAKPKPVSNPAPGTGTPGTATPVGGGSQTGGGAHAGGGTANSPGVGSGNNIQAPVDVPVNACGNTVDVISLLNPAFGNDCANDSSITRPHVPAQPGEPSKPPTTNTPTPPVTPKTPPTAVKGTDREPNRPVAHSADRPVEADETLAQTGADSLGLIIPVGAGMLLAGAVLYRRARA